MERLRTCAGLVFDLAARIGAICAPTFAAIIVVLLLVSSRSALAETRMALVIGNSDYAHAPRLPNPTNDATAVAAALRKVGFGTVEVDHDLGKVALESALQSFASKARGVDVVVIYYAGHGIEMGGTNYLVPTDARLASDGDVEFEAVPLDLVLHAMSGGHRLKLVILDACRNNPFLNSMSNSSGKRSIGRGLARVEPEDGDMLVAYAAKEGSTADDGTSGNSPFARALTKELITPGIEVRILFGRVRDDVLTETGRKQEPAIYGSLGGLEFYFIPPSAGGNQPAPSFAAPIPMDPKIIEKDVWDSVASSNDPAQLKIYLDQYPKGAFAGVARAKIASLNRPTQVASLPPANMQPTRPSAVSLAVKWEGTYFYTNGQQPGTFNMDLYVANGEFEGQTYNEKVRNMSLHAYIKNGRVMGRKISWQKTYDGHGASNTTQYQGELSSDGTEISGTWTTQGISGSFLIHAISQ